jgi:tRNA (guanine-N7-)-methyltransferase
MLRHALAFPHLNILGLEVRQTLTTWIDGVIRGENIGNAHAEWYSMANGLDWIATGSVQYAVYLFPDPWPKNRHHKRRAFNGEFLKHLHRVLVPDGRIWLASDRQEVVDHQNEILSASELFTVVHPQENVDPGDAWPFPFTTDQQMFCDDKGIPYVQYYAQRRP